MESLLEKENIASLTQSLQSVARDMLLHIIEDIEEQKNKNKKLSLANHGTFFSQVKTEGNQSTLSNGFIIERVKNVQQHNTGLCGFHCLFNIIHFLKYLKTGKAQHCVAMNSIVKFWRFHKTMVEFLINHNRDLSSKAIKALQANGSLERSQLAFIIAYNQKLQKCLQSDASNIFSIFCFFFGFGILQGMIKKEIIGLQEALDRMRHYKGKKNLVYVLILGITEHYAVLIIQKDYTLGLRYFYLDSLNTDFFSFKKSEDIIEFAIARFVEKEKLTGESSTEWDRSLFIQFIHDLNKSIQLLDDVLAGNQTLYGFILESIIKNILSSFFTYFTSENMSSDHTEIKKSLWNWISNEYHPRVLENELNRYIEAFKCQKEITSMAIYGDFLRWMNYCDGLKQGLTWTMWSNEDERKRATLFGRFFLCLEELRKLLGQQ